MIQVPRICTNTFNYAIQSATEIMPVCKISFPYLFAATLCAGFKEKVETASCDTLIHVTSNLLLGSQWLFTCAAVAAILYMKPEVKAESITPSIKTKKIVKYIVSKKEFESMKAEIARLEQELDEANQKLNSSRLIQQDTVIRKNVVVLKDIPKSSAEMNVLKNNNEELIPQEELMDVLT